MNKPIADLWYGAEPCQDGIVHIRETHIDQWAAGDIWLIRGSEMDLVFDTGTGIVPLEPFISMFSNKPKLAVSSCYYYDHAGGMYGFKNRACHELESDLLTHPPERACTLTEETFYAHPKINFQVSEYRQKKAVPTQTLKGDDSLDLGNRQLKVLHIPGRTPGSIALWEKSTGFLFGGETAFIDPFRRDFLPEHSVEQYENSLMKLASLPVHKVFGGHYGVFNSKQFADLIKNEIGRYTTAETGDTI